MLPSKTTEEDTEVIQAATFSLAAAKEIRMDAGYSELAFGIFALKEDQRKAP